MSNIDVMSANAIRVLAADAIQKAKSGHPGLPLGCADIAYVLWGKEMNHNPKNPDWRNRDRFILSGGHGSTLLYSTRAHTTDCLRQLSRRHVPRRSPQVLRARHHHRRADSP